MDIQGNIIHEISDNFAETNGAPIMCWSSEGHSTKHQIFDSLMTYKLGQSPPIYHIASKLRFIDLEVGRNEETVDFNAKHLATRCKNYFIDSNFTIGKTTLFRKEVKEISFCS